MREDLNPRPGAGTPSSGGERAWWQIDSADLFAELGGSRSGLDSGEAARRLALHGPNRLRAASRARPWPILLHQFKSPLIYMLLAAMVISLTLAHWQDAIVIGIVLALNGAVGFAQEFRAEGAIAALMRLVTTQATVLRDGQRLEIDSNDVVPGDIVLLESGDVVPADLRLLETIRLECDEAMLTGESLPVGKLSRVIDRERLPVSERENMVFAGTSVTMGRGRGLVVATGRRSQIGTIAEEIREPEFVETPLQRRMARLGRGLALGIIVIGAMTFATGLARGETVPTMFLTAVAITVAAIPEGLPIVMTVALAVGVRRMAKRNAIVRRLPAVETLGACTVVVTDKTGTLTENQMTVRAMDIAGRTLAVTGGGLDSEGRIEEAGSAVDAEEGSPLHLALLAGTLCNESDIRRHADREGEFVARGDPTEVALLVLAAKAGLDRGALLERYPQVGEVPFEPARKYAATIHQRVATNAREGAIAFVKGAPERVVQMCDREPARGGSVAIDPVAAMRRADALAAQGLRVLAVAVAEGEEAAGSVRDEVPEGLCFLGLIGMLDPPRDGAREAVQTCRRAGIEIKMVTGDHAATAGAVAAMIGLAARGSSVVGGDELAEMTDDALLARLRTADLFARVSPLDKQRIVRLLRDSGEVVAVTGDGVNDAPALKAAHVGASMGRGGTDVAREASEIILADDHFATIGAAVEEGRVAFSNIRKATVFLVSSGVGELLSILGSVLLGLGLPFLPAQILWLNVVTNGVEDVALAMEPAEPDEFHRKPRSPREGVLTPILVERIVVAGLVMAAGTLTVFLLEGGAREQTLGYAQVSALTTMVVFQVFHVGNCRSQRRSVLAMNPFSNRFLFFGVGASLLMHVGAMHFGPTQQLLRLQPLELETWGRICVIALSIVAAVEVHKLLRPVAADPGDAARSSVA